MRIKAHAVAAVATVLVLASLAGAAPTLETIDLRVGEQVTLPAGEQPEFDLSDHGVISVTVGRHAISLLAREVGASVFKLRNGQGRRTFLVRVRPGGNGITTVASADLSHAPADAAARPLRDSPDIGVVRGPQLGPGMASPQPQTGLQVRTLVDKPQAVPDDVVTYTLLCRNNGPEPQRDVVVETEVPAGVELLPMTPVANVALEPTEGRVVWQVPSLEAEREASFSFRARIVLDQPGTRIETLTRVRSATMESPVMGPPVSTEIVSVPLLAAFAIPDVVLAQTGDAKSLIDVQAAPGQSAVDRLQRLGVLEGFPDGSFRPEATVSRAEATKMIVSVVQLAELREQSNITVALRRPATVRVAIQNADKETVRVVADAWSLGEGTHQLAWDGRNADGEPVDVGVYRYEVTARDRNNVEQVFDGTIHAVGVRPLPADLTSSFVDVPTDAWFHPYIAAAEQWDIVRGYPGDVFRPRDPIRRVENTVMVVRAAGLTADAEARMNAELGFTDAGSIPKWAVGYVAVATEAGPQPEAVRLVAYNNNEFLPEQTLTRAEAAAVLERLLDRTSQIDVPLSGRVARGHELTINGETVSAQSNGRFRSKVSVDATQRTVRVAAR